MKRAAADLTGKEAYALLIDSVVPRPVAWVTSLGPDGEVNLAPFSFFSGVSARPPIVSLAISSRPVREDEGRNGLSLLGGDGRFVGKDTLRNVVRQGHYVIHLMRNDAADLISASASDFPPGTNVPGELGLETLPGEWGRTPRLAAAPVALECRMDSVVEVGRPATYLLLGEVMGWHVDDELVDEDGRIWAERWSPLARLGVDGYGGCIDSPADRR